MRGRGSIVVGIDVAREMVALARTLHPEVEFVQGDAHRLPFDGGSFDAVVGNFVVLHLGRPEQAAAEFARVVLVPGGTLALSTWDVPARARLFGVFLDAIAEVGATPPADVPPGPPFFRFSEDGEFARLLEGAALDDVEVRTISFRHHLRDADVLWDGLLGGTVRTGPLVLAQPDATQARIRATFDRLVAEYASDGGLEIPVAVKLASGRQAES